jgi:outer membrane protein assembly factor BamB
MRHRELLALGALVGAVACGGGQTGEGVFTADWHDDNGQAIAEVQARLAGVRIPLGADIAVGVTAQGGLIGRPLAGGTSWTFQHALDARPVIAGNVVVASGAGELFALEALTGRLLWSRPTGGLALHGAGDDGKITVATLTRAAGRGSVLLAVGRGGDVLRQVETAADLGAPAVVAGLAFVPWENQYVSVLDIDSGIERARVLLREKTSHAFTLGGGLYFGELGLFRFDDTIRNASRGAADHVNLPATSLPGHPLLMRPGDEAERPVAGAEDKSRIYARPTAMSEPLAIDGDRFYATYFRYVMGLTAGHGRLTWARTHDSPFIGGAAAAGGLYLCDAGGKVTAFDGKTGAIVGEPASLGAALSSCVVQVDGLAPSGAKDEAGSLVSQIQLVLADQDLELDAGRKFLLRGLAALDDASATETLLRIAVDGRTPPTVRDEAKAALANRRTGGAALVHALGGHYDFLHDVLMAPPVGALARALAAMNDKSAAAPLARQLLDPAISDADVLDVAQALAVLAGPSETPALAQFLTLYRAAPDQPEEIVAAVGAVGEALLRIGSADGRAAVDAARKSASTNASVRAKLTALVEAQSVQRAAPSTTPSSTSRE